MSVKVMSEAVDSAVERVMDKIAAELEDVLLEKHGETSDEYYNDFQKQYVYYLKRASIELNTRTRFEENEL